MRVSKNSDKENIAGALAGALRGGETETLDAMGPIPVYTAVKAIILVAEFIKEDNLTCNVGISKYDTVVSGTNLERTVLRFTISPVKMEAANA